MDNSIDNKFIQERSRREFIIFKCEEGNEQVKIRYKAAMHCHFVKKYIEKEMKSDKSYLQKKREIIFDFPYIKKHTLDSMREYLEHFEDELPPEIEKPFPSGVDFKYKDFLVVNMPGQKEADYFRYEFIEKIAIPDVADLAVVSMELGVVSLFDLCCSKLGEITRAKTGPEIFQTFNMFETFTYEDKLEIEKKNQWISQNFVWNGFEGFDDNIGLLEHPDYKKNFGLTE